MKPNKPQDIQVCPECGGNNACQSAAVSGTKFSCWCQEVVLSESARLELEKRGLSKGCLCQACLKLLNDNDNEADA